MSSSPRSSREEERRLSIRTLVIASAASAMAAIVTSQFWIAGTPIAAAVTPVIVTLVSELLHRPTQKFADRFTTEADGHPRDVAGGYPPTEADGPVPRREAHDPEPARDPRPAREARPARDPRPAREAPARARAAGEPEFRVYRTSRPSSPRRLPWKPIAVTAAIAFIVGMAALTLPELIAGQSLGSGDRKSTIFGGGRADREKEPASPERAQPEPERTAPDSEPDQPDQTDQPPPETQPKPEQPAPTVPDQAPTQPSPQSTPPRAPPAPSP